MNKTGRNHPKYLEVVAQKDAIKKARSDLRAEAEAWIRDRMHDKRVQLSRLAREAMRDGVSATLTREATGQTSGPLFAALLELTAGFGIEDETPEVGVTDYGLYVKKYRKDEDSHTFGWNVNDKELVAFLSENPEAETAENFNEQTAQIIYGGNASAYWHYPDRAEVIRQMREVVKVEADDQSS